mmetsp:Transcript_23998/g.45882  ORF Transcript_23998/g.45882 Transcript_23998/m.45882 type:complete len:187 (+) Transcript_23998:341-901(+)
MALRKNRRRIRRDHPPVAETNYPTAIITANEIPAVTTAKKKKKTKTKAKKRKKRKEHGRDERRRYRANDDDGSRRDDDDDDDDDGREDTAMMKKIQGPQQMHRPWQIHRPQYRPRPVIRQCGALLRLSPSLKFLSGTRTSFDVHLVRYLIFPSRGISKLRCRPCCIVGQYSSSSGGVGRLVGSLFG